ncbi:MAG: secretin N-terminal domain-containing protein [Planctomycetaceae bacterium]
MRQRSRLQIANLVLGSAIGWGGDAALFAQQADQTAPEAAVAEATADAATGASKPAATSDSKPAADAPATGAERKRRDGRFNRNDRKLGELKSDGAVVDFTESSPEATKDQPNLSEKRMSFKFSMAPWKEVLRTFAQEAGLTLQMDEVPDGTFNYEDDGSYTPTEALDILNGYLQYKGFVLLKRGKFLVVVNLENGIPNNLVPRVSIDDLPKRGKYELVSVFMPLGDVDIEAAAQQAREILGPHGNVLALTKLNQLLVRDTAENLIDIHKLLSGMGAVLDDKSTGFRPFQLTYISAVDAERILRDLFGLTARGTAMRVEQTTARTAAANAANRRNDPSDDWRRRFGGGGFPGFGGGFAPWAGGGGGGFGNPWGGGGDRGNDRGGDRDRDRRESGRENSSVASSNTPANSASRLQMTVDARTNRLLVMGTGAELAMVEKAIKEIDVPDSSTLRPRQGRGLNQPQLAPYQINSADPQVVVDMLYTIVPNANISVDSRTRSLYVYATPAEQELVRGVVRQLDSGAGELVATIPLRRHDPIQVVTTLRSLMGSDKSDGPQIEPVAEGRRLIVRGSPDQIAQVKKVLADLGEDGTSEGGVTSSGGPIRTISPGNHSAEEVVALVQRLFPQTEGGFIRVVSPSAIATPSFRQRDALPPPEGDSSQFRGRAPAAGSEDDADQAAPPIRARPRAERTQPTTRKTTAPAPSARRDAPAPTKKTDIDWLAAELEKLLDDGPAAEAERSEPAGVRGAVTVRPSALVEEVEEEATAGEGSDPLSDVRISIYNGKIVIASENQAALDRYERLIQSLTQTSASRTKWTVYYLRAADATTTATVLGELFQQSSVARTAEASNPGFFGNITGQLSSLGSSLMDATGLGSLGQPQVLRIVPELRQNALFISGSAEQVDQVLEALRVLDSNEMPPSLRDRVPRMIAVEYADVEDVAEVVRDVYKEQLEGPPQQQQQQQGGRRGGNAFNPFAMLMGGSQNNQQANIQLSIGVDTRTNTLVVSASDQLFRQVEELVKSLDASALEANRTVRVVTLQNSSAELVQGALKPLLGKVNVSTTESSPRSRDRSNTSRGNANTNMPAFGGDPNAFMMMRMMQGGGAPFGGGTFNADSGRTGRRANRGGGAGGFNPGFGGFGGFGGNPGGGRSRGGN